MRALLVVCLLAACAQSSPSEPSVLRDCGQPPIFVPYFVEFVTLDGQKVAEMPLADYDALQSFKQRYETWSYCVGEWQGQP